VLLAGGLARRMGGGDKPMRTIAGRTILERVVARLKPQCDGLILNAKWRSRALCRVRPAGHRDGVADFPGPLAAFSRPRLGRGQPA
jgi:molybdopterin-guanine dinucleotide biosynthesis protein A